MKKTVLTAALLFVGISCAVAQSDSLGVGIAHPSATLHLHNNTPDRNDLHLFDSNIVIGNPGDLIHGMDDPGATAGTQSVIPFAENYTTSLLMTNGNTGETGGFLIRQHNYDVLVRQSKPGSIIFEMPGGKVFLAPTGRVGIGDTNGDADFLVKKSSLFAKPVAMTDGLTVGNGLVVTGGLRMSGAITASGAVSVGSPLTVSGMLKANGGLKVGSGLACDPEGNMKVKHLRVTTTDWPDYVFGEGYGLMPLNEVEAYVQEHGHLPAVPAAAEVEQDGVDQAELNKLLMQKVEELTLYIIDLQKQIEELRK